MDHGATYVETRSLHIQIRKAKSNLQEVRISRFRFRLLHKFFQTYENVASVTKKHENKILHYPVGNDFDGHWDGIQTYDHITRIPGDLCHHNAIIFDPG